MKDWEPFKLKPLPVGSGKGADKVLGDKSLFALGGTDGFRTRIVPLSTGGQIRVRTKNGMPEYIYEPGKAGVGATPDVSMTVIATLVARLASLYMTSGAYAFGALGGVNQSDPMLTVEPVTYKSDAVAATEAAELVPHYDKTPPANGQVSKIYNHTVNPGGLNGPKLSMLASRPSEFSGLMRRCMQGRYGSGNTKTNMVGDEYEGSVAVGSSYARTTGILRFGDVYVFAALETDQTVLQIRYWPLLFQDEVSGLLGQSAAKETLALSRAYVVPAMEKSVAPIGVAVGAPVAYGWHFSLTTNQATCCINEPQAYGYDRRQYRRMKLQFSFNAETYTLACSYVLEEDVNGWIVPSLAPIWSPLGNVTLWYNQRSNNPAPDTEQNFPVYSYFIADDLKLVRWQWKAENKGTYNEAEFYEQAQAINWQNSYFGPGSGGYTFERTYGNTVMHGFSVNGSSVCVDADSKRSLKVSITTEYKTPLITTPPTPWSTVFLPAAIYTTLMGQDQYNSHNPFMYPSGLLLGQYPDNLHSGNHYSVHNYIKLTVSQSEDFYVGTAAHVSALVIPAHDCQGVYIGKSEARDVGVTTSRSFINGECHGAVQEWWIQQGAWNGSGYDPDTVGGKWCADVVQQVNPNTTSMGVGEGPGYALMSSSSNEAYYVREIALHTVDVKVVGAVDSEIFHPNIVFSELTAQIANISSSLYGDTRHHVNALGASDLAATNGYPTDITLFVGAS